MTTRTPPPPLFPYTTLFRSDLAPVQRAVGEVPERRLALGRLVDGQHGLARAAAELDQERVVGRAAEEALQLDGGKPPDRKSTRLNSSHRCISYAVFCLKKKM